MALTPEQTEVVFSFDPPVSRVDLTIQFKQHIIDCAMHFLEMAGQSKSIKELKAYQHCYQTLRAGLIIAGLWDDQ